jgi:LEA14-like dessication related protein
VKKLFYILAAGAIVYGLRKLNLAKKLQFELNGVDFGGSFLNPDIYLKVKLINPTGTTATLNNLTGIVSLNNNKIGNCTINNAVYIAANTTTILNIKITLFSVTTIQSVINAITNKTGLINFVGTAKVDSVNFPINYTYKL